MARRLLDQASYPWDNLEATELHRCLWEGERQPASIDLLYRKCAKRLPALTLNQSPDLIWTEALNKLAAAGAMRKLLDVLAQSPLVACHEAVRALRAADEASDELAIEGKPAVSAPSLWPVGGAAAPWLDRAREALRAGLYSDAEAHLVRSRRELQAAPDPLGSAAQAFLEGQLSYLRGEHDRALASYTTARDGYQRLGIQPAVARIWIAISRVQSTLSDMTAARQSHDAAAALLTDMSDPVLRAEAYIQLASIEMVSFRMLEAREAVQRALHHSAGRDPSVPSARGWDLQGEIDGMRGYYGEAKRALGHALEHWEFLANRLSLAGTQILLGYLEYWWYNHDAALSHFRRALDEATDIKEHYCVGLAQCGMGLVYCRLKLLDYAAAAAASGLAALTSERSLLGIAHARRVQATIALERGSLDDVEQFLGHASLNLRGQPPSDEEAFVQLLLGDVAVEKGDEATGRAHYERALATFEQFRHEHGRALSLLKLGRAHRRRDDLERARGCFDKARTAYASMSNPVPAKTAEDELNAIASLARRGRNLRKTAGKRKSRRRG